MALLLIASLLVVGGLWRRHLWKVPRVRIVIPEGATSFQIAKRLGAESLSSEEAVLAACHDPALRAEFGVSGPSLEGYLFPATYDVAKGSSAQQIVRLFARHGRQRREHLFTAYEAGFARLQAELGWGELEVVTLASIVEKEAVVDEERPLIARVYLNRLTDPSFRPKQRLQADPTAGYGCLVAPQEAPSCANYNGRITPEILRDARNRYNTYRHPGLPPGPIANPGEASIIAVLNPADSDYLYFVATGQGRHAFSRTFAEHHTAIHQNQ